MKETTKIIMGDIKPLYEKWLNENEIPMAQIGLFLLGSSIACLQESGYSATSIIEQVTRVLFPDGVLEHARKAATNTNRPLNPQEVKIVTDYATRNCEHEWEFDEHDTRRCIKCNVERF